MISHLCTHPFFSFVFLLFFLFSFLFIFFFCFLLLLPLLFIHLSLLPRIPFLFFHFPSLFLFSLFSSCILLGRVFHFLLHFVSYFHYLVPHRFCALLTYLLFLVLCHFLFPSSSPRFPLLFVLFAMYSSNMPSPPPNKKNTKAPFVLPKKAGPGVANFKTPFYVRI